MIVGRHTLLVMTLFLGGLSLVADGATAGCSSMTEVQESSTERVQHLLTDSRITDSEAVGLIFKEGDNALSALITAVRDRNALERASRALAYLGGPKERKGLADAIGAEKDPQKRWLMASLLAGALVEPTGEDEWRFLETCLQGYKREGEPKNFAAFSAALALGVNASPHALHLLQLVEHPDRSTNSDNDALEEIGQAIRWIKQGSTGKAVAPMETEGDSGQIENSILRAAFFVAGRRDQFSVENMVFGPDKQRVLVSVELYRGRTDAQGYDIRLERRSGIWTITGVWFSWVA